MGLISLGLALTGALVPGPVMVKVFQRARNAGYRAGLFITLGHGLSELVVSLLLIWGLKQAIGDESLVLGLVAFAGAAVLAVMGFLALWGVYSGESGRKLSEMLTETESPGDDSPGTAALIGSGVVLSVVNPYWVVWWLTAGASYLLGVATGWAAYWVFLAAHVSGDAIVYVPLAIVVGHGLGRRMKERWYQGVEVVCGLCFVGFAVMFVVYGIGRLTG